MSRNTVRKGFKLWLLLAALLFALSGCAEEKAAESFVTTTQSTKATETSKEDEGAVADLEETTKEVESAQPVVPEQTGNGGSFDLSQVSAYSGNSAVTVNNNQPFFSENELTTTAFENYSSLDGLGRCGVAYANICREIMPTKERGAIGQIKPSGWHTVKYNDLIDGNYLYNRCHLIGYQLAGENANEKNLITGTRYLNTEGMLPYENQVADYVKATGNHVLYRVTPIFEGNNLVASGVLMEAKSVEDKGAGVCFCIYVYNVQPGIRIDYATGESEREPGYTGTGTKQPATQESAQPATQPTTQPATEAITQAPQTAPDAQTAESTYILNTNTHKFHRPDCSTIKTMAEKNKLTVTKSRDAVMAEGYEPCKRCNP